jgi:hypothetical protein
VRCFDPCGFIEEDSGLMAFLLCYFDESGKFHDKDISTFCGFVARGDGWGRCYDHWTELLFKAGLTELKATKVLRYRTPLSSKKPALGIEARTAVLAPFMKLIRQYASFGIGISIDCAAFRSLPEADRNILEDPHLWAFRYALLVIAKCARQRFPNETNIKIALNCDDEEANSVKCLKLYTNLRMRYPEIKRDYISIGFGDDKSFFQLQAADMLASLVRQEVELQVNQRPFDMRPMYQAACEEDSSLCSVFTTPMDAAFLSGIAKAERQSKHNRP